MLMKIDASCVALSSSLASQQTSLGFGLETDLMNIGSK